MDNKKHKKGDIVILSPDLQKKRNRMFGIKPDEKPMYDLSSVAGKIAVFEIYDSLHKEWACRVSGQKFLDRDVYSYLVPESAIISVKDKITHLLETTELKGVYKNILKTPNVDLFLFLLEISQQAHSPLGSTGIVECVGKKIVKLSKEIFPDAKLGTTVSDFYKFNF